MAKDRHLDSNPFRPATINPNFVPGDRSDHSTSIESATLAPYDRLPNTGSGQSSERVSEVIGESLPEPNSNSVERVPCHMSDRDSGEPLVAALTPASNVSSNGDHEIRVARDALPGNLTSARGGVVRDKVLAYWMDYLCFHFVDRVANHGLGQDAKDSALVEQRVELTTQVINLRSTIGDGDRRVKVCVVPHVQDNLGLISSLDGKLNDVIACKRERHGLTPDGLGRIELPSGSQGYNSRNGVRKQGETFL
jgi:hypothetical protein